MKILHTADLHLGQIIYEYDRRDEHRHFFGQLRQWCVEEKPDALLVCGDVFDIQQPSAAVKAMFNHFFVDLHRECPAMHIVIIAGNHDSASRLSADSPLWSLASARIVGIPPSLDSLEQPDGWQADYVVKLEAGFIIALPYMSGERRVLIQSILDYVERENVNHLPVVMMAHQAVTGSDITGHDPEIGTLKAQEINAFGKGYDYLALGHIHKPQTLGINIDNYADDVTFHAPVARYSGSALHVSCDETYPHTVSIVTIDRHGGDVNIRQRRIDEYRHFYILPEDGSSFNDAEEAIKAMKVFVENGDRGYFRFRFDNATAVPSDFNQRVYDTLAIYREEWRYNPRHIWTGDELSTAADEEKRTFEIAEIQQITEPISFVGKIIDDYPTLDLDDVRNAFEEVSQEIIRINEQAGKKKATKTKKS